MAAFRLAHLSDPHLPMEGTRLGARDYFSKRLLSHISWQMSRRWRHRPEVLARIAADIAREAPDHVAVTGDLTNLSLPAEFAQARDWLSGLGAPTTVSVIAGNHDWLTGSVEDEAASGLDLWQPWMRGDDGSEIFPYTRIRGQVALVGVNTAVPTPPFLASGRVGADQLSRLETQLLALKRQGLFRIVLIHHPITDDACSERKHLSDRLLVRGVLGRAGAELVLHGHTHKTLMQSMAGPTGLIPVLGAPSASANTRDATHAAGWNLISVERRMNAEGPRWHVGIEMRRLTATDMATVARYAFPAGLYGSNHSECVTIASVSNAS